MEERLKELEKQKEREIEGVKQRFESTKIAMEARMATEVERIESRYQKQIMAINNSIKAKATKH